MLPIALRADGRRALIVGGGNAAARKAEALLDAGISITVVASSVDPALRALLERSDAIVHERAFAGTDLAGVAIVVAATTPEIDARVLADARASDVPIWDATHDAAASTLARMRTYVRAILDEPRSTPVLRELAERSIEELARMNPVEAEHEAEEAILRVHGSNQAAHKTASVICASRASALATTQTRMIAARLAQRGIATTILNLTTTGDRIQDRPINELGSVNVWVKELEVALLDGRAEYAVHSCKDLPGELADGMHLAAISLREDPRDAFCSERYATFDALPKGAVVGTSSPRRRAQLQALRSDLRFENLRGNIDTRLRKLRNGECDAIVLAMAGLNRLGVRATHTIAFDPQTVVPAVAQGALAIETLASNQWLSAELYAAVNHEPTQWCVEAERTTLRALRAGCSAPLGVHARLDGPTMTIDAAFEKAGGTMLRERLIDAVTSLEAARALGKRLAERLETR
jgi:hydroxymethylbilane synthase